VPVILRVDCDNGYIPVGSRVSRVVRLALNYLNENYFSPHWRALGYLAHLEEFVDYLVDKGVKASLFLKYTTLPSRALAERMVGEGFELGLHLFSARTYSEFLEELRKVERASSTKVYGFTKHGDGLLRTSRKHAWRYEPRKYVEWGLRAGLRYFAGNEQSPVQVFEKMDSFTYFHHVYYVEPWHRRVDQSVVEIAEKASSGLPIVVLVHPCNWVLSSNVRRELELLLSKTSRVLTFREFLKGINS